MEIELQRECEEPRPRDSIKPFDHGKSLSRDFVWTLCGNITYSACQWAFVVVLAKAGSPEDVGQYALGLATCGPLLIFANCQGRNLVASDVQNTYRFGDYLGFRIVSLAIALMGVTVIAVWTQHTLTAIAVTCLLGLSQAFDWISETYFGLMQKNGHLKLAGQSLMLKGMLCLSFLASAMYLTRSLVWATLGLVLGRGLTLWCFDVRNASLIAGAARAEWNPGTMAHLLRSTLPLGVISVVAAVNLNIPRYFVEAKLSTRDLGIFAAIASLVGVGNLVMSALANTSFVSIAKAVATCDRKRYRRLSIRLVGTAAALGLVGVAIAQFAGRDILMKVFRPEYGASAGVLTRLMVAASFSYIISGQGYALTAARVLTPQIPILFCAVITTSILCWWLVPIRGMQGAAEAMLLSSVITLTVSSFILARVNPGT